VINLGLKAHQAHHTWASGSLVISYASVSHEIITFPYSFSTVSRASGPVLMFCTPGLVFGSIEGVGSRFHVLRSQTHFRLYRGRRVPFSCLSARTHFRRGTDGVGSRFHVLRACTLFRRYRGRQVPFSYFALPNSFSGGPRASGPVFLFCASGLIFGGTERVRSRFHVLRYHTHFRRYRGRPLPFSCFARPNSFSAVPTASGLVFLYCAPSHVFGGAVGVGSCFQVLRAVLVYGDTEGVRSRFNVLRSRTHKKNINIYLKN
jgi:hypothetical protein